MSKILFLHSFAITWSVCLMIWFPPKSLLRRMRWCNKKLFFYFKWTHQRHLKFQVFRLKKVTFCKNSRYRNFFSFYKSRVLYPMVVSDFRHFDFKVWGCSFTLNPPIAILIWNVQVNVFPVRAISFDYVTTNFLE